MRLNELGNIFAVDEVTAALVAMYNPEGKLGYFVGLDRSCLSVVG